MIHQIAQGLAVALVVILNWVLAHEANAWTMPSEVQSAFQFILGLTMAGVIWLAMAWGASLAKRFGVQPPELPAPALPVTIPPTQPAQPAK